VLQQAKRDYAFRSEDNKPSERGVGGVSRGQESGGSTSRGTGRDDDSYFWMKNYTIVG
jgi:hypothetical protein